MHQRIKRLVFLGAVLANILFALGTGLTREEKVAKPGLDVHAVTEGGESGAGLLVLVDEDTGGPAAARIDDESHSIAVGTLPESSSGIEEHAVIPQQVTAPQEPSVAPDAAGNGVTTVTAAIDSRDATADAGGGAIGELAGSGVGVPASAGGTLLVKTEEAPASQSDGETGQSPPATTIVAERPSACVRIGPFAERPDIRRLLAELSDSSSAGDSYTTELADRPIFWVHVSPRDSAQEAHTVQKGLAARGIEGFVISDLGPLHNGISLGVFRDPDSAQRLASTRAGIGYPVAIHESLGKRTVHFARVRVPAEHAARLIEVLNSRAQTQSDGASATQVECDDDFNARVAGAGGHG